jgi:hypothetical protein
MYFSATMIFSKITARLVFLLFLAGGPVLSAPADQDALGGDSLSRSTKVVQASLPDTSDAPVQDTASRAVEEAQSPSDTMATVADTGDSVPELQGMGTDSLDSLARIDARDSLLALAADARVVYEGYPTGPDTLLSPDDVTPLQVYRADASGLSFLLRGNHLFQSIPFIIGSSLNRALFWGFPAAHTAVRTDNGFDHFHAGTTVGTDIWSAAEARRLTIERPGTVNMITQPVSLVVPETLIQWEGGLGAVFDQNFLNLRFARPLTRKVHLGIFTTTRILERQDFSHSRGGITPFYRDLYGFFDVDTSLISTTGRNPLSNDRVATVRLARYGDAGEQMRLSYKYTDLHFDRAVSFFDTAGSRSLLTWEELSRYRHNLSAGVRLVPAGPVRISGDAYLQSLVVRTEPIDEYARERTAQRGEGGVQGAGVRAELPIGRDTIAVSGRIERSSRTRYDSEEWSVVHATPELSYRRGMGIGDVNLGLGVRGGYDLVRAQDEEEGSARFQAEATGSWRGQELRLYGLQGILPPVVPFDPSLAIAPGRLADRYRSLGVESVVRYGKLGLILGHVVMDGVNPRSVSNVWPQGVAPYPEPENVTLLGTVLGRWKGFSLDTRWFLADKRPYAKAQSALGWLHKTEDQPHFVDLELLMTYWSRRDLPPFAGTAVWNRKFYDLSLHAVVQIKTFRLVYKIDNMFNRRIAYVPGYELPGLTFRWGFNWLIPG